MASSSVLSPNIAWVLCHFIFCSISLAICNETGDRQALLCFKSQLSGPSRVLSSWSNTSLNFCNWDGVTCSSRSPPRVIAIDLSSEGITGTISPCIANLTSLMTLQLSNNSLHGSIPPKLGLLRKLRNLNLSMNSLEGNIPSQLSSCSQIEILDLSSNSFQGAIPASLGKCIHLQDINLSRNNLQGRIPSAFGNLSKLQALVLTSTGPHR